MSWTQVSVVSLSALLLILTISSFAEGAAVRDDSKPDNPRGAAQRVFVPETDASSFFKRRGRRSVRYYELQVEQRMKISASEQRREYNEEQRDEYENYLEEDRDEQGERTRETTEQMREYHYDGLYPRYHWFH
ncbi:upper zone of growth plate and cartilage matrix associated a [Betta splendens]|uniref:Unique cartilage matrix-associated protein n=1 Tax=Betta splendens TaxID=158456 RepID=A0A6P7NF70_BETSP|nr:upper zone of growth plate and cartilage matrix associated a [Betta splendens]